MSAMNQTNPTQPEPLTPEQQNELENLWFGFESTAWDAFRELSFEDAIKLLRDLADRCNKPATDSQHNDN